MKKRVATMALLLFGLITVVFVSYKQPPINYLGGEAAARSSRNQGEDSARLVAPVGVFQEELFKQAESSFGKRIQIEQFSDQDLLDKLSHGIGVDLVAFRNDYAHKLYSRGLIQRFDTEQVPDIETKYLDLPFTKWAGNKTGSGPSYSVAYLARMTGIVARSDAVPTDDVSWGMFWDPKLKARVGATSLSNMIWLSAVVSKIDLSLFSEDIQKALTKISLPLKRLMNNNIRIYDSSESMLDDLAADRIDVAMIDERVGRSFAASHKGFMFLWPREGLIETVYCLCVPIRVRNLEISYKIVDLMFTPVFAASLYRSGSGLVLVSKAQGALDSREKVEFGKELEAFDKAIVFPNLGMQSQEAFDTFVEQLSVK